MFRHLTSRYTLAVQDQLRTARCAGIRKDIGMTCEVDGVFFRTAPPPSPPTFRQRHPVASCPGSRSTSAIWRRSWRQPTPRSARPGSSSIGSVRQAGRRPILNPTVKIQREWVSNAHRMRRARRPVMRAGFREGSATMMDAPQKDTAVVLPPLMMTPTFSPGAGR